MCVVQGAQRAARLLLLTLSRVRRAPIRVSPSLPPLLAPLPPPLPPPARASLESPLPRALLATRVRRRRSVRRLAPVSALSSRARRRNVGRRGAVGESEILRAGDIASADEISGGALHRARGVHRPVAAAAIRERLQLGGEGSLLVGELVENFAGSEVRGAHLGSEVRGTHPELRGDGGGERGFALGNRAAAAVDERLGVGVGDVARAFDAADGHGRAVAGAHGSLLGERRRVTELAHAAAGFELEVAEAVLRGRVMRSSAHGAAEHPAFRC